jgi:hypothetical protein
MEGFSMPIRTSLSEFKWLTPTTEWKSSKVGEEVHFSVDENFYIDVKEVSSPGN